MTEDHRKVFGAGYYKGLEQGKPKGQLLPHPLSGKWFHSYHEGKLKWQGQVLGAIFDGSVLVQLYGWSFGEPTSQEIVKVADMSGWKFYDSDADMRIAHSGTSKRWFEKD